MVYTKPWRDSSSSPIPSATLRQPHQPATVRHCRTVRLGALAPSLIRRRFRRISTKHIATRSLLSPPPRALSLSISPLVVLCCVCALLSVAPRTCPTARPLSRRVLRFSSRVPFCHAPLSTVPLQPPRKTTASATTTTTTTTISPSRSKALSSVSLECRFLKGCGPIFFSLSQYSARHSSDGQPVHAGGAPSAGPFCACQQERGYSACYGCRKRNVSILSQCVLQESNVPLSKLTSLSFSFCFQNYAQSTATT